jgi:hypothetical protein
MTRLYSVRGLVAFVAILGVAGCEAAKSANPTAPTVAGPIPGVSISAPKPLEPGSGAKLFAQADPYTLLIENAGTSGPRAIWLELEVAADANFQQIVHQADKIEPGPNGRTSYRLPEPLGAGFTYYWRVRAADGANSGPYSTVSTFTVVPPVVIDAPVAVEPSGRLNNNNPDFRVNNGAISGTVGVAYRFEVSRTSDFSQIAAIVTVPVNSNGSTLMALGSLPYSTTFYWRARGSDGAKESNYSNTLAFTTRDAPVVAPPPAGAPTDPGRIDSSAWTTEQWKKWFMALAAQKGGPTVSDAGLRAMRADLLAAGSDFQNGWRGDMRPRMFLPVPGCPIANRPDVPVCSYNRTVDLGGYGGPWQWDPRF